MDQIEWNDCWSFTFPVIREDIKEARSPEKKWFLAWRLQKLLEDFRELSQVECLD